MTNPSKSITIPIDGSKNALKALDYVELILGPKHDVKIQLCYIMPSLPLIFDDGKNITKEERARKRTIEKKNVEMAERIMAEAKSIMLDKGFPEENMETVYQQKKQSVTKDVCFYADRRRADTILLTRHGRTEIKDIFMGEISKSFVDYCQEVPVWIVGGSIKSRKILIAVDASDNALRAVDHAAYMLSGTDCEITVFHTLRHITRFVPMEVIEDTPDLEEAWRKKAGSEVTPYIEKSKSMLTASGIDENRITVKVVDGSRSPANDIMAEAKDGGYGTIVLGRRGISLLKEFFMGSVTSKVIQQADGFAVWIIQ